jgi:large subunit ribosomal protein L29
MKKDIRIKELRAKSPSDLIKERLSLLKDNFSLRMQRGTRQLKKHHFFRKNAKDIARINTILSEEIVKKKISGNS